MLKFKKLSKVILITLLMSITLGSAERNEINNEKN